jgi:hypothetical protein
MNSSFSSTSGGAGHPIQIVDITSDHKFKLNEDNLQTILNHPKARMKKVILLNKNPFSSTYFMNLNQRYRLFQWLAHSEKENRFC